jgi:hypothetical protein
MIVVFEHSYQYVTRNFTMNDNQTNLTGIISEELINNSLDIGIEYSELVLDDFLGDGVLKEVPFIKTIYSIGKIGESIRERFFVKKLFSFLKQFHQNSLSEEVVRDFRVRFTNDKDYRNEVTEQLMIYIDSFLTTEKSKILAKLFSAHLAGHYDWPHFNHLATCLNSMHPKVFPFLHTLSQYDFQIPEKRTENDLKRDLESEALLTASGIAYEASVWSSAFRVSEIGKDLYNFGIK